MSKDENAEDYEPFYAGDAPVFIVSWNLIDEKPSVLVWEEGWDCLDNEERKELLNSVADTIMEMNEHIVPDYPPDDLQA